MTWPWWFLALCCILGTLTSAFPTDQPAPPADDVIGSQLASSLADESGELQDWTESLPPRALAMERHLDQYERAAVNMADEDLFPVHLCEKSSLNRMHRALSFIPHDAVLRALLMVTMMQSEGCREGAMHTATKLRELIKSPTSQQLPDVIRDNDVTSKQEQAPTTDSDEDKGGQAVTDHCSAVDECRWRGVAEVRTIMADEADLLLLYDTVAAGVFGASGRTKVARALGLDLLQDLQDEPHKPLHPRLKRSHRLSLHSESDPFGLTRGPLRKADFLYPELQREAKAIWEGIKNTFIPNEADVQYWVGWIPLPYVSAAYNAATSVYYGLQGNHDLARQRLKSAGVDLILPLPLRRVTNPMTWRLAKWGTETVARKGFEYKFRVK